MKSEIIGSLIIMAILFGAIGLYLHNQNKHVEKPDGETVYLVQQMNTASSETKNKVGELLEKVTEFNKTIDKGIDVEAHWDAFRENPSFGDKFMNDLINTVSYEPAEDLRRVRELLRIAEQKENIDALMYAQQILHDLYYWVYDRGDFDVDYWGATTSFEAENQNNRSLNNKIRDFIEVNKQ